MWSFQSLQQVSDDDTDIISPEKVAAVREGVKPLLLDDRSLQRWCSDRCIERFLVSRRGVVENAVKALSATLEWRKEYRPEEVRWGDVARNGQNGRVEITTDRDVHGRPIMIYSLRRAMVQSTHEEVVRYWVYNLEAGCQVADELGCEQVVVLADLEPYSDAVLPSMAARVECLRLSQAHYPERLALGVIAKPPFAFWLMWTVAQPFLDERTRVKLVLASDDAALKKALEGVVPPEVLPVAFGGQKPDTWDFEAYGARMRALDERRQKAAEALSAAQPAA